jgi:hypothetical protein
MGWQPDVPERPPRPDGATAWSGRSGERGPWDPDRVLGGPSPQARAVTTVVEGVVYDVVVSMAMVTAMATVMECARIRAEHIVT